MSLQGLLGRNTNLRNYQKEALTEFVDNEFIGIFEMATGTGKTITSLFCAKEFLKKKKSIFLIIVVPYTHLVDQWIENLVNLNLFENHQIIKCFKNTNNWKNKLHKKIRDYNVGFSQKECIITTYKSLANHTFWNLISRIKTNSFLIADECHNIGVASLKKFDFSSINGRLGLSATPERWFDEKGTQRIREIFDKTVFEYPLDKAIEDDYLVEYEYHPIVVQLNDIEIQEYEKLSYLIAKAYSDDDIDEDEINMIKRRRSLLILKAEEKKQRFFELVDHERLIENTILYCAEKEINFYTKALSNMDFKVHRFDSKINKNSDRKKIIETFSRKELQILIAIKCLDEGVDIPSVRNAYLLASTTNPKEFIQRRGRILRKHSGKDKAVLYDFIVLPENIRRNTFLSIAYREMPRFSEFARSARNKFSARKLIRPILQQYNCEHLLDISPWEVYQEQRKKWIGDVDLDD